MFPRDRVIASLYQYEITFTEAESDDDLREKLATFYPAIADPYADRAGDQAEAIFLLLSPRLSKTTGHVIPVDGGLQDGFMSERNATEAGHATEKIA